MEASRRNSLAVALNGNASVFTQKFQNERDTNDYKFETSGNSCEFQTQPLNGMSVSLLSSASSSSLASSSSSSSGHNDTKKCKQVFTEGSNNSNSSTLPTVSTTSDNDGSQDSGTGIHDENKICTKICIQREFKKATVLGTFNNNTHQSDTEHHPDQQYQQKQNQYYNEPIGGPSPSSFEVMKKMRVLDKNFQPEKHQENMNKASAALALSALFNGSSGDSTDNGNNALNSSSSGNSKFIKRGREEDENENVEKGGHTKDKVSIQSIVSESDDDRVSSPQNMHSNLNGENCDKSLNVCNSGPPLVPVPPTKRLRVKEKNDSNAFHQHLSTGSPCPNSGELLKVSNVPHVHDHNHLIENTSNVPLASSNEVIAFTPTSKPTAASASSTTIHCNSSINGHGPYFGFPPSQQNSASMISFLHRGSPIPFVNYNINNNINTNVCHVPTSDVIADKNNCQSMTSRTISALHSRNTFTPSTKRNYTTIYPRMNNPLYTPSFTIPHCNTKGVQGLAVDNSSSSTTPHQHIGLDAVVTPSPSHLVNMSNDRAQNEMNINIPLPNTVSSSSEITAYQHNQNHHHVVNDLVRSSTPFLTPAKGRSSNESNIATSLEFTPKTTSSTTSHNHGATAYNRKDKSLGLLCENFIRKYSNHFADQVRDIRRGKPAPALSIDEAARSLSVERRRIYDIINILEAIRVVERKCKNMYYWFGLGGLTETFCYLQKEGLEVFKDDAKKNKFLLNGQIFPPKPISNLNQNNVSSNNVVSDPEQVCALSSGVDLLLAAGQVNVQMLTNKSKSVTSKKLKSQNSKEKSLAKLSQKFIQLFLVGNKTIAMNDASDKILGPTLAQSSNDCESKEQKAKVRAANSKLLKTKIRRLYDVANVLVSIGIIQKLNGGNNMNNALKHRPSFRWVYEVSPEELLRLQYDSATVMTNKLN